MQRNADDVVSRDSPVLMGKFLFECPFLHTPQLDRHASTNDLDLLEYRIHQRSQGSGRVCSLMAATKPRLDGHCARGCEPA